MRRRQASTAFEPFVFYNPYRVGAGPKPTALAIVEVSDGYMCVEFQIGVSQLVAFAVKKGDVGGRYVKLPDPAKACAEGLRDQGVKYGATLEAIQLLGHLLPLSKHEEGQMAAAKLAKPKTEELKAAAKAAPVASKAKAPPKAAKVAAPKPEPKAAPAAKKGLPDALAKAQAARRAKAAEDRTYKVVKGAKNTAREGTWTHTMLDIILANTSTAAASAALKKNKEFGDRRLDFKWAEDKGHIKF